MIMKVFFLSLFLTCMMSVTAFSPLAAHSCTMRSHSIEALKLHPDQAPELIAAACEIMKDGSEEMDPIYIDDTKIDELKSHLSATGSTPSAQNNNTWWSKSFGKFISSGN